MVLLTERGYSLVMCWVMSVYELRDILTDSVVVTEQLTPITSTTDATSLRAVHTLEETSPPPREARNPSPSDNDIRKKPQRAGCLAAFKATVILNTSVKFWEPLFSRCSARQRSPSAPSLVATLAKTRADRKQPSLTPKGLVCLLFSNASMAHGSYRTHARTLIPASFAYDRCVVYSVTSQSTLLPNYRS